MSTRAEDAGAVVAAEPTVPPPGSNSPPSWLTETSEIRLAEVELDVAIGALEVPS